jgi:uncharacterized RDD family membrane protein YckC
MDYGGFLLRAIAYIIDGIILGVIGWVVGFIIRDQTGFAAAAVALILGVLYYGFLEGGSGQATLGKRLLGLKVTDVDGNAPGMGKAFIRAAIMFVFAATGILWIISVLFVPFTERKQALHDMLAGCLVLKR